MAVDMIWQLGVDLYVLEDSFTFVLFCILFD